MSGALRIPTSWPATIMLWIALVATIGTAPGAVSNWSALTVRDTAILVAFMMSLPVLSRSGAGEAELHAHFHALQSLLDDWRVAG